MGDFFWGGVEREGEKEGKVVFPTLTRGGDFFEEEEEEEEEEEGQAEKRRIRV